MTDEVKSECPVTAFVGVGVFLTLGVGFKTPAWVAAIVCIAVTFVLRILTVRFDIRTHPVHQHALRSGVSQGVKGSYRRLRGKPPGDLPVDSTEATSSEE
jgi:hypothetical protein